MANLLKSAAVFEDPDFPLTCRRHKDHGATGLHGHEFHELVVILSGHGRHRLGKEEYPIEGGDVFVIRGTMSHGYAEPEHMVLENILFDPQRLGLPMRELRDLPGFHALFRVEPRLRAFGRIQHRLRLSEEELAEAAGLIFRLEQELERKKPGYRFVACAHLMNLIGFLSRCYTHSAAQAEKPLLRMGEVLSYIEQHHHEPITVKQLTKRAGMSESTLMRTFRRVFGRSPIDHVIRVRIGRACQLLQRDDIRITEAAFQCGFTDSNYFSRQFHRVVGMSPREYRRRSPGR